MGIVFDSAKGLIQLRPRKMPRRRRSAGPLRCLWADAICCPAETVPNSPRVTWVTFPSIPVGFLLNRLVVWVGLHGCLGSHDPSFAFSSFPFVFPSRIWAIGPRVFACVSHWVPACVRLLVITQRVILSTVGVFSRRGICAGARGCVQCPPDV